MGTSKGQRCCANNSREKSLPRRDLIRWAGISSAFLIFPFPRLRAKSTLPAPKGFREAQGGQLFDPCPPFNQFSEGYDCGTRDCHNDFKCTGGILDDYECTVHFTCGTVDGQNQFRCEYSFDTEDCEGEFSCSWFVCEGGGYTPPTL